MLEKDIFEEIKKLVKECGQIILEAEHIKENITSKEGSANFVTAYDKKVQEKLQSGLQEILPGAAFVGEENDCNDSIENGFAFIVDPIDGTTNFIKGYQTSAISVGITYDGVREAGIVYNPYTDELFYGQAGKGAYLNGEPLHVSESNMEHALILFGTAPYYQELWKPSFDRAYYYFEQAMDVRRSGSAAIDLCAIAAGRADLFFEYCLSPWDYAAGALLIEEAGGRIFTLEEEELCMNRKCSVIAMGSGIWKEKSYRYEK